MGCHTVIDTEIPYWDCISGVWVVVVLLAFWDRLFGITVVLAPSGGGTFELRWLVIFYGCLLFHVFWRGVIGVRHLFLDDASTGWLACGGPFVMY